MAPIPIGNARDITLRTLDALRDADVIACEDTRMARRLMDLHGIAVGSRPLIAYHEHNAAQATPRLMALIEGGGRKPERDSRSLCGDHGVDVIWPAE